MNRASFGTVFCMLFVLMMSIRQGKVEYLQILGLAALGFALIGSAAAASRSLRHAGFIALLLSAQLVAAPFVPDFAYTHQSWGLCSAVLQAVMGWFMFSGFGETFTLDGWKRVGLLMRVLRVIYIVIPVISLIYLHFFMGGALGSPAPRWLFWLTLGGYSSLLLSALGVWICRVWKRQVSTEMPV